MNQFKHDKVLAKKAANGMFMSFTKLFLNKKVTFNWDQKGTTVLITKQFKLNSTDTKYYYFCFDDIKRIIEKSGASDEIRLMFDIINLTTGLDQTNG